MSREKLYEFDGRNIVLKLGNIAHSAEIDNLQSILDSAADTSMEDFFI